MANTTNFNWATPDDTDLVKDGAAAIRTLGSSIDSSLVDLKGGTTGQILSKASNTDLDYTWIANDQGDITEVQAGTGISVASGTGPIPIVTNTVATEFDAKGDLVVGTGADTFDRLAAGANGETLVADSSTTTGLAYREDYAAGKNKIINGDFRFNQRAFSSTTTNGAYGFDRWAIINSDGTTTYSAQTFTLGTAPVVGYEGTNFARVDSTGQTATSAFSILQQKIEDVRTFAGQTVTVSFWAKAGSGTPSVAIELQQHFGTGGSPSTSVNTALGKVAITTSWARYSATVAVPSISGKTLGTANDSRLTLDLFTSAGTDFNSRSSSLGIQTATIDFWGVQVEDGSVATAFNTATGTLAGELAACQRYYYRSLGNSGNAALTSWGMNVGTTEAYMSYPLPVQMRVKPSAVDFSAIELTDFVNEFAISAVTISAGSTPNIALIALTSSGLTQYRPSLIRNDNNAAGFIGFSAEL